MPCLIMYTEPYTVNGDKNGIKRTYWNKPCLNQVQATTLIKKKKPLAALYLVKGNKYHDFYIIVALLN